MGGEGDLLGEKMIVQLGKGCQDPLGAAAAVPNPPAPETVFDLGIFLITEDDWIRASLWKIFWIFGRPFDAVSADYCPGR